MSESSEKTAIYLRFPWFADYGIKTTGATDP